MKKEMQEVKNTVKKMKNVFTSVTDKLSITKERISESEEIYKKKMEQSV
jgi:hypothetical protein